jgi:plastocyanin
MSMKLWLPSVCAAALAAAAARPAAPAAAQPGGAQPAPPAPARPAPARPLSAAGERAQLLREAADQLEKAGAQLERGNRNLAEQLFSTAELLIGAEALAPLAGLFREGAPPRITAPTQRVDLGAAPQPKVAGSSEADDEAARAAPRKAATGSLTGRLLIDGKPATTYGLITLEPASGKWKPRTPKRVVVEQRGREFLPSLLAVSVGSTVEFPNFDSVFHNVFSTSPAAPFDLGLYKAGEARSLKLEREGIVRLGCNLHANMSAHIAVVAAPAYVVTDDKGQFAFRRLVPGRYKLRAWSVRSRAPIAQEVIIRAGANAVEVGVAGDAPAGAPPDKFGGKRG